MFVPSLIEVGPVVTEKKTFKFCQSIFPIGLLSPLEKGHDPSFEQLESLLPKDALCHVWLKLTQWSLKRLFLNVVKVFCSFVIVSQWKRA